MKRFLSAWFVATLFAVPATAHIQLESPAARTTDQKTGPCGAAGSTRGNNITTFEAGETITVTWEETVNHPGHYRISFDPDGQDDFVDPAAFDDFNTNSAVMMDNIDDNNGGDYSEQITLPNEPCETCTLQVVQVMTDKAPYGDGNDLYYQCADIRIVAASGEPDMGSGGEPDAGTIETDAGTPPQTGNNSAGGDSGNSGNPQIDDGFIDDGTADDEPTCSTAGAAAVWPLALLIAFGWIRRRR